MTADVKKTGLMIGKETCKSLMDSMRAKTTLISSKSVYAIMITSRVEAALMQLMTLPLNSPSLIRLYNRIN